MIKQSDDMATSRQERKACLEQLRMLNIVEVEVLYCGGGDEGQVDSVDCYSQDANGEHVIVDIGEELIGAIEATVEGLLGEQGIDWYNNYGGSGHCVINVPTGEVTFDHCQIVEIDAPFSTVI